MWIARSAIERVVALPFGEMLSEAVPFLSLHPDIGVDEGIAELLAHHLAGIREAQRVEKIERQLAAALHRVPLGIHVDVEALARITLVVDAVKARRNDARLQQIGI